MPPEELIKKYSIKPQKGSPKVRKSIARTKNPPDLNDFIYVPSINIWVAKQRTCLGKNWFDCHKDALLNNQNMMLIPEFIEFLKYLRLDSNNPEYLEIFKEITEARNPWRAEWLDADFKVKNKEFYINYNHILNSNGELIPNKSEKLENCLMKNKTPGIDLKEWLNNSHTKQGLPNKKIKSGDLYYLGPGSDNNSVARFDADSAWACLNCDRNPSFASDSFGYRAVRRE
jgi:hypothetical protein